MTPLAGLITLVRLAAGVAGSVAFGWLLFGAQVFRPEAPPFLCVSLGFVFAAILAFVRGGRRAPALFLPVGWAAAQFGLSWYSGWPLVLALPLMSLVVGFGLVLLAEIFDRLAIRGYPVGKFLILGPMTGALYLAATPLMLVRVGSAEQAIAQLWLNFGIGVIVGDGVALGVEIVDLALARWHPAAAPTG